MPAFWKQAARLVKPGGSVAIFCRSSYFCRKASVTWSGWDVFADCR